MMKSTSIALPDTNFIHPILTSCATDASLLFGDQNGYVHICENATSSPLCTYHVFDHRVMAMKTVGPMKDHLLVIGEDGDMVVRVKLFPLLENGREMDASALFQMDLLPELVKETVEVVCLDANEDFVAVAIDTTNTKFYGNVILFKGNIVKGKAEFFKRIDLACNSSASGLGFRSTQEKTGHWILMVATSNRILRYTISPRGDITWQENRHMGCPEQCAAMTESGDFVCVSKNQILTFRGDVEKPATDTSLTFEPKIVCCMSTRLSTYLVMVAKKADPSLDMETLTILDLDNGYRTYERTLQNYRITNIFHENGSLFVLAQPSPMNVGAKHMVHRIEEKDIQTRLDILIKKYDFEQAIRLAKRSQQFDEGYELDTRRMYGDYLLSKGSFEQAIEQYKETIGHLEPSYVIRNFLDSQRNDNLIAYLEDLHRKKHANKDHTTLLLSCYTRLRDSQQEDQFARPIDPSATDMDIVNQKLEAFFDVRQSDSSVSYDPKTAINVLREAGFREKALNLAKRFDEHDLIIRILVNDYDGDEREDHMLEALQHIEMMGIEEAEQFMRQYGKSMVTALPNQATNFMIRLCTVYEPIADQNSDRILHSFDSADDGDVFYNDGRDLLWDQEQKLDAPRAEEFIFCFVDEPFWLMVFLENVIFRLDRMDQQYALASTCFSTLTELYLKYWDMLENVRRNKRMKGDVKVEVNDRNNEDDDEDEDEQLTYEELFFQIEGRKLSQSSSPRYEIRPPNAFLRSKSFHKKIMYLLEKFQHGSYDLEYMLALMHPKHFHSGILFLYDKLGLHYDILHYHMEKGSADAIIDVANKHKDDQNMWTQVLSYFCNDAPKLTDLNSEMLEQRISQLLQTIREYDILPMLLVVDILTEQNEDVPIGFLKDFLIDNLSQEQAKTDDCVGKIKKLQIDTKKLQDEIEELRTSAKIFQLTTCSTCSEQLDLPAVHFMCMHSYHQRCLSDIEECPKCSRKNKEAVAQSTKYDKEIQSSSHETFFKMLREEKNGFDVVATYLGRNIFKQDIFDDVED